MKTLRHSIAALLLVLTFTSSLCAGVMSTPIAPDPTPTPTTEGATTTNVDGVMSTPNAETTAAGGSVTDAALALIQGALSLF